MPVVHVFLSAGRFRSFEELRAFADPTFDEDGEEIESPLMRETALEDCEPMCVEAVVSETNAPVPPADLLRGASYAAQWLGELDDGEPADAALCLFAPNRPRRPENCSLRYAGAFPYST